MQKETKTIFIYPTDGVWQGQTEAITDNVPIPDGYTDVRPPQPAFKVKFIDGEWQETATEDEINSMSLSDDDSPKPSPEQLMIAQLTLKVAKLEAKDE